MIMTCLLGFSCANAGDGVNGSGQRGSAVPTAANRQKYYENISTYLDGYKKKYFVYVSKTEKKLYLIDRTQKVWKSYMVATGEAEGVKMFVGDRKTPSGVYKMTQIYQYQLPWYLSQIEEKMKMFQPDSGEYLYYLKYYRDLEKKHRRNRQKITALNSSYLSAEQGHVKFGTDEDLGYNAYGPVFMRIDYPNYDDIKRYNQAIENGEVPENEDGEYVSMGGGIAIHGTNDTPSLGNDASSGCVRMENNDILELSNYVSEGTMVVIE